MSKKSKSPKSAKSTISTTSTTATPAISIIVPSHNTSKYIAKCLDAILAQTFQDFEVICVDDGSDDDTVEIISRYATDDSRITLITNSEQKGVSSVRNQGIERARSRYIMFCDSDDFYEPEMCAEMLAAIKKPHVDLALCETNVIYHAHPELKLSDDYFYSLKFQGTQPSAGFFINETDTNVSAKIFKKSLLDKYHIRFPEGLRYEDAFFCAAYISVCDRLCFVNQRLYNYIRHRNSIMSDTFSTDGDAEPTPLSGNAEVALDHLNIAELLFDFYAEQDRLDNYNEAFWVRFAELERLAICLSRRRSSKKEAKQRSKTFVNAHLAEFNQANPNVQRQIRNSFARWRISTENLKLFILRYLPTTRFAINNVLRLKALSSESRQSLRLINQELEKKYCDHV